MMTTMGGGQGLVGGHSSTLFVCTLLAACAGTPAHDIAAEAATRSAYVEVLGSRIHYLERGVGKPILLLHGQPTSSFLWRRVIPGLSTAGREIAPDLIGFGESDQPDIEYSAEDHTRYLEAFIEATGLSDMVIVGHDWGSYLGAQYAIDHRANVRGLVFMEAIFAEGANLTANRGPGLLAGRAASTIGIIVSAARADSAELGRLIEDENVFVERFLPQGTMRRLTNQELDAYRAPWRSPRARRPMAAWPEQILRELPGTEIRRYSDALTTWPVPKLLLTVEPGVLVPRSVVDWARASLPTLTVVELGFGLHFVQEDHPEEIASAIVEWMTASGVSDAREEGYVTTASGARMHYLSVGSGEEVVLIPLTHYLAPTLDPLAGGRRLVNYEPVGRGASDPADTTRVTFSGEIDDLETLRETLGIERMALIGWSGLGKQMAVYASRFPERVTRLVQISPVGPSPEDYPQEPGVPSRSERLDTAALHELEARRAAGEFSG